jgi:phospholipase C
VFLSGNNLEARNSGAASAHLIVWPIGGEFDKPLHLDVAGTQIVPVPGARKLLVTGPNGFRREIDGASTTAEVHSEVLTDSRTLVLRLANLGSTPRTFVIGGDRKINVKSGRVYELRKGTAKSQGWYDLTVTVAEEPGFRRRLVGHIENGKESISQP